MKTYNNKIATSKLVAKFDNELLNTLQNDLKEFLAKNQFLARKRQAVNTTLFVA